MRRWNGHRTVLLAAILAVAVGCGPDTGTAGPSPDPGDPAPADPDGGDDVEFAADEWLSGIERVEDAEVVLVRERTSLRVAVRATGERAYEAVALRYDSTAPSEDGAPVRYHLALRLTDQDLARLPTPFGAPSASGAPDPTGAGPGAAQPTSAPDDPPPSPLVEGVVVAPGRAALVPRTVPQGDLAEPTWVCVQVLEALPGAAHGEPVTVGTEGPDRPLLVACTAEPVTADDAQDVDDVEDLA